MFLHKTHFLSVAYRDDSTQEQAQALAEELGLTCFYLSCSLKKHTEFDYLLLIEGDVVSIAKTGKSAPNPVRVDFVNGAVAHRRLFGGGKGQDIAKAVGVNKRHDLTVLDATAGLGRDAFVLASLGCDVTLLERNPLVRVLLKNGLGRATQSEDIASIIAKMHFQEGDISDCIQTSFDVIYLDPMYPHVEKSAAVKKEMAFFRDLVGHDEDSDYLLPLAKELAAYRVVVKRPKGAPFLNDEPATYQITGKSGRFDIYVNKSLDI